MIRQFVSTCYLVKEGKFFLLFHPKHKKWIPPGGHLEENETPQETARREVREEVGAEIVFLRQENVWVDEWNACSIERPFSCLLEQIPARGNEPAHEHIDFIFVAEPIKGPHFGGRWFSLEEVETLKSHEEIFHDTKITMQKIAEVFTEAMV